ncbi:MAG: hypothetical protein KIT51_08740 [Cyclobacteriaceae bacterium]|nr:MAG: hypothetical protein KIT51_08740 [Cyclobacteriaceae bacterium]
MTKNNDKIQITYPLWMLLGRNIPPMLAFVGVRYFDVYGLILLDVLFLVTWIIIFYLIGQYRYTRVLIDDKKIEIQFIMSLYLKNKIILYKEILSPQSLLQGTLRKREGLCGTGVGLIKIITPGSPIKYRVSK